ncbi:MAG: prepilin-type N-terminal cleavage/methylation domain-containing protein [Erysipelotrichaceae bacterium]
MKNNSKGFTLVEIVVVLAIIAILAAILIPTMNGFVNDAKKSQHIAEARAAYVAAQYIATRDAEIGDGRNITSEEINKLSGMTGITQVVMGDNGKVSAIIYWADPKNPSDSICIEAGKYIQKPVK